VDPVPDPLKLRKSGSAGDRTRDLCISSQKLWLLDHRGGQWHNILLKFKRKVLKTSACSCGVKLILQFVHSYRLGLERKAAMIWKFQWFCMQQTWRTIFFLNSYQYNKSYRLYKVGGCNTDRNIVNSRLLHRKSNYCHLTCAPITIRMTCSTGTVFQVLGM